MKPNSKDRLKLFLISFVFLLSLSGIIYVNYSFIFHKSKAAGMYTSLTYIVNANDVQQIEHYRKYSEEFAIKVQENDKFYLKYNSGSVETKLDLTADQYNKLDDNKVYYFKIKYSKPGDETHGILQEIYTDNPLRD